MKGRKTIEVSTNGRMGQFTIGLELMIMLMWDLRVGISNMVEQGMLFNSKNYNGFQFINNDDSEVGTVGYYSRYYHLPKT